MEIARALVSRVSGLFLVAMCLAAPVWAAVQLASPQAEQQAKFAVPAGDAALIYVYRPAGTASSAITVNMRGHEAVRLGPGTFFMWRTEPGQAHVSVEPGGDDLVFRAEAERVYYIEVSRKAGEAPRLRKVPFAVGRPAIQRLRMVSSGPGGDSDVAQAPSPAEMPDAVHTSPPSTRPRVAVAIKGGGFTPTDDSQTLAGTSLRFDDAASSLYVLEGEWFVYPTTSLGLELVSYSHNYTTTGAIRGSADLSVVLLNLKRYLRPEQRFQPYAGLGLGFVNVDLEGGIAGSGSGPAFQLAAGLQWRVSQVFLRAEYKYLRARAEDDNDQEIDVSGSGAFVGIGLHF